VWPPVNIVAIVIVVVTIRIVSSLSIVSIVSIASAISAANIVGTFAFVIIGIFSGALDSAMRTIDAGIGDGELDLMELLGLRCQWVGDVGLGGGACFSNSG
jgi:hypothetical protein